LLALLLALAAPPLASPALAAFGAGAATVDITPRPAGGDPNGFASRCPAAVYSGPRQWGDDEPYVDVNGNGQYDSGEPYCDFNANGRHDQIFTSGASIGSPVPATSVHDPLTARAIAVGDGSQVAVVVSVVAQGLFNNYTDQMAAAARQRDPAVSEMVVSANHNESSPDTIGIYGGPAPQLSGLPGPPAGAESGIDDYYMSYLVGQVAQAAAQAASALTPATLRAEQFPIPANLRVRLSDNWPTTDNSETKPTAIDPKIGLLQARDGAGHPIFTVMSLAAHNQEIGHANNNDNPALSSDWPGYFEQSVQSRLGGQAMFLVADNGSEEDPGTLPPVGGGEGTYEQAQATGQAFADTVVARAAAAQPLTSGTIRYARSDFCVPVENTLFKAAAAAGLFGQRPTYLYQGGACQPTGVSAGGTGPSVEGAPDGLQTTVSVLDLGPDLQLVDNPGESFPALMLGSPWGLEDVPSECRDRANPPVPLWRSHALFRFNVGLANDMIGYEIPPWAFIGSYGTFASQYADPACQTGSPSNPTDSTDSAGHHHKLETEGLGPTGSSLVAGHLAELIGADRPDAAARVGPGRFVMPDGHYSRNPAGAVGILLPDPGKAALDPAGGLLLGAPGVSGLGGRAINGEAVFMDYDGQPQVIPDVTTRGMLTFDSAGCVAARYYLDVFPALDTTRPLGSVQHEAAIPPPGACPGAGAAGVTQIQRSAGESAGVLSPTGARGPATLQGCAAASSPRSAVASRRLVARRGHLRVTGSASARGCRAGLARVTVEIVHAAGHRCRFVVPGGSLTAARSCRRTVTLLARGRLRWSLALQLHLPRGTYHLVVRAVDAAGHVERQRRGGANAARLRVT
jgi:hypothetical protein